MNDEDAARRAAQEAAAEAERVIDRERVETERRRAALWAERDRQARRRDT